jgi:hypothetical protein
MLWCTCAVPYKCLIDLICTSRPEYKRVEGFQFKYTQQAISLDGKFESRPWVALLAAKATGTEQLNNF